MEKFANVSYQRSPTVLQLSTDFQKQKKIKERNCKTSSPTHFFPISQKKSRNETPSSLRLLDQPPLQHFDIIELFTIFGPDDSGTPKILGYIDKHGSQDPSDPQTVKYLKRNYPWTESLEEISMIKNSRQLPQKNTYISTDVNGNRIYIQSLTYKKFIRNKGQIIEIQESMQFSSANSQPLIETLQQALNFIYQVTIVPKNQEITSIEQQLIQRYEFLPNILFHYLSFKQDILHAIQLQPIYQFNWEKNLPEFSIRNVYKNNCEFKIESFNFELLFKKVQNIEKILQLIRALLLEKKVIIIKEDISDVAIIMLTLISLLSPFKWNYTLITNLPENLIEALESPTPFLIGIQKSTWDSKCKIEMMDNIVEENFVIFEFDLSETRGLRDIYDVQNDENIQFPENLQKDLRTRYFKLLSLKDDLISQLTQRKNDNSPEEHLHDDLSSSQKVRNDKYYSFEKAENLYWIWFQLKLKQAFHHLYLQMMGNVQCAFRPNLEQIVRQKGRENICSQDIIDTDLYLKKLGPNCQFMEVFVQRQAFAVFIEELYHSIKSPPVDGIKNEIQIFYQSLRYLQKHEDGLGISFSDKSLRQLRNRQNQAIDKVYIVYKQPVPYKFQYIIDDYMRHLCISQNVISQIEPIEKYQIRTLTQEVINAGEFNPIIDKFFITKMKGIDFDKIQLYLQRIEQKKQQRNKMKKLLKSQDSKFSDNNSSITSPFLIRNPSIRQDQSTDNLFGTIFQKSRSSRRENIISLSQNPYQENQDFMKSAKTSKAVSSTFYNQFLNDQNSHMKPPLKQFIQTQNSTQISKNVGSSLANPMILSPKNDENDSNFSIKNLQSFSKTCRNSNQIASKKVVTSKQKQTLNKYKSFNSLEKKPVIKQAKIDLSQQIRDSIIEQEIQNQYYSLGQDDSSRQSVNLNPVVTASKDLQSFAQNFQRTDITYQTNQSDLAEGTKFQIKGYKNRKPSMRYEKRESTLSNEENIIETSRGAHGLQNQLKQMVNNTRRINETIQEINENDYNSNMEIQKVIVMKTKSNRKSSSSTKTVENEAILKKCAPVSQFSFQEAQLHMKKLKKPGNRHIQKQIEQTPPGSFSSEKKTCLNEMSVKVSTKMQKYNVTQRVEPAVKQSNSSRKLGQYIQLRKNLSHTFLENGNLDDFTKKFNQTASNQESERKKIKSKYKDLQKELDFQFRFSNADEKLRLSKIEQIDPYQIDSFEDCESTKHKKKKSIFSNNDYSTNRRFAQTTLIGGLHHHQYQTNQMMTSHVGDVDNEPRTPKTPSQMNEF